MKKMIKVIATISSIILAYGYWHSYTHATANINLTFKISGGENKNRLSKANILFLDSVGNELARGVRDKTYNYVHLIHPDVGDCHEVSSVENSKKSTEIWRKCFKKQSVWIPTWIKNVSQVQVLHSTCLSRKIPVIISEYNTEWFLWWVPHPHIGGKPYTYYSMSIVVKEDDCII